MHARLAEVASLPILAAIAAASAFVGGFAALVGAGLDPLRADFASAIEADYARDDVVLALPALSLDVIEAARSDAEALRIPPGTNVVAPPDLADPPATPSERLVQDAPDTAEAPAVGPQVASFDTPPLIDQLGEHVPVMPAPPADDGGDPSGARRLSTASSASASAAGPRHPKAEARQPHHGCEWQREGLAELARERVRAWRRQRYSRVEVARAY